MKILDQASQIVGARALPGRKTEAWKYLSLKDLAGTEFRSPKPAQLSVKDRQEIRGRLHRDCHHVVIWNGEFQEEFLNSRDVEPISIADLNSSWRDFESQWLASEKQYGLTTEFYDDYVQGLRRSGIAVRISAKTQVMKPIQVVIGGLTGTERVSSTDIWVDAEPEAQFEMILDRRSETTNNLFLGRLRMRLQKMSRIELIHLQDFSHQDYDFFRTSVFLEESARLNCLTVQKGGKLTRHNADIILTAENGSADLNGLYFAKDEQVCDHHTLIDHTRGNCVSRQLYKGILDGNARAVFDGQVQIRKGALKASSEQLNKNLLLSTTAEADSKPQLEVAADDVKATHGSAIGQLSDAELFYLESRGIDANLAREMLARGFVDEVVEKVETVAFREMVTELIAGRKAEPKKKPVQKKRRK